MKYSRKISAFAKTFSAVCALRRTTADVTPSSVKTAFTIFICCSANSSGKSGGKFQRKGIVVVIIMGPTGPGKTTTGAMLAAQLNWQFADAASFHPPANIEKMSKGIPLNDADRAPWLAAMRKAILEWIAAGKNVVLACSALKRAYREELRPSPEVKIVYLKGDYALFAERIRQPHGHFAGQGILAGQFADLEEPDDAITIDAAKTPGEIRWEIRSPLALS